MLGVREFYRVGGAQAIAASGLRHRDDPARGQDRRPGNLYVTAAKKLVSFDCAIDMLAGPTEVVIVSDSGKPAFIAADLVAQAEHDPEAVWHIHHYFEEAGGRGGEQSVDRSPRETMRSAANSLSKSRGVDLDR